MEAVIKAAEFALSYSAYFLIYFAVVNLIAFVLYAIDKSSAKRKARRIPEKRLIGAALIGGSLGAFLGMVLLRHKTKHTKFVVILPLTLALHTALFCFAIIASRL